MYRSLVLSPSVCNFTSKALRQFIRFFLKLKRHISSETVRRAALPKIPTFHPDPKQMEMVMWVSRCKSLNCSSSHLKGDSASLSSRLCAFPPGNIPRLKQRQPDFDSSPHSHAEKRFRVNKH